MMFLLIALVGYSQKDSASKVCVDRSQAITALKKDDSLQVAKKEISILEERQAKTDLALHNADSTAKAWQAADQKSQLVIKGKDSEIRRQEAKFDLSMVYNTSLNKTIRRKSGTIRLISGVSVSIIGTLTYLLVKK
jgi:hypothetical protein